MPDLKQDIYTLVQHSGFGYAGKPGFEHAVEIRRVETTQQLATVGRVSGMLFTGPGAYAQAAEAEDLHNGVNRNGPGIYPKATGTFSVHAIDGLAIYIPAKGSNA